MIESTTAGVPHDRKDLAAYRAIGTPEQIQAVVKAGKESQYHTDHEGHEACGTCYGLVIALTELKPCP